MNGIETTAIVIAVIACLFDVKSARIPNWLTFSAALLAVVFHSVSPDGNGLGAAIGGLVVGLLIFFPVFALGAMGAGDVKLMAALGAWVGWYPVIYVALFGSIAGGVLGVLYALTRGHLRQALRNVQLLLGHWFVAGLKPLPSLTLESPTALRMPYAVPIAVGALVALWVR